MGLGNQVIEQFLIRSHQAIVNALEEPDMLEVLEGYNYDKERLTEGLKIYEKTYGLYDLQYQLYGDQYYLGEQLNKIRIEAVLVFAQARWSNLPPGKYSHY